MASQEENCRTVITHKGYHWHDSPHVGRVQVTQLLIEIFAADGSKLGEYPVGLSEPNTITLLGIRVDRKSVV